MNKKVTLFCLLFSSSVLTFAQNNIEIDKLKGQVQDKLKSKPFTIKGGVALNTILTTGTVPVPQPFTYVASANVNIGLYGYNLPFSFTYSNMKFAYTNPSFQFNRAAFNPRYKKFAGHFGDVSMTFSPYTLNGLQFKGAGFDYMPDKWKFQIMYGRFLRGVPEDTSGRVRPSFKRMGMGFKAGYYGEKKKLGVAVFYANEDKNSIPLPQRITYQGIRPMENICFSIESGLPVSPNLSWDSEWSSSVLTQNLSEVGQTSAGSETMMMKLLPHHNSTTHVFRAIKTGLNYTIGQQATVGLAYERVDPNYQTLGGYFFTNDFENITINSQYKGDINAQFSTGLQHDDLANKGTSSLNRMVVSGNVSFKPTKKADVALNYSNFQSYTFIRSPFDRINRVTPFDNLDTLNFTQLAQNAGVNLNYMIKQNDTTTQSATANISFMESANQRNQRGGSGTKFINTTLNYNWGITPIGLNLAFGFNYSLNLGTMPITTLGPTVSASKSLFDKKVATNAALSYNRSRATALQTDIMNLNLGANTTVKEKHNFNLNVTGQYRRAPTSTTTQSKSTTFNFTISAGYNYAFDSEKKKKTPPNAEGVHSKH